MSDQPAAPAQPDPRTNPSSKDWPYISADGQTLYKSRADADAAKEAGVRVIDREQGIAL